MSPLSDPAVPVILVRQDYNGIIITMPFGVDAALVKQWQALLDSIPVEHTLQKAAYRFRCLDRSPVHQSDDE